MKPQAPVVGVAYALGLGTMLLLAVSASLKPGSSNFSEIDSENEVGGVVALPVVHDEAPQETATFANGTNGLFTVTAQPPLQTGLHNWFSAVPDIDCGACVQCSLVPASGVVLVESVQFANNSGAKGIVFTTGSAENTLTISASPFDASSNVLASSDRSLQVSGVTIHTGSASYAGDLRSTAGNNLVLTAKFLDHLGDQWKRPANATQANYFAAPSDLGITSNPFNTLASGVTAYFGLLLSDTEPSPTSAESQPPQAIDFATPVMNSDVFFGR